MAVDVTITRGYRNTDYFDSLNPQTAYVYAAGEAGGAPIPIPGHNALSGLQGDGAPNEFYHLTQNEFVTLRPLVNQLVVNSALDWVHSLETDDLILHGEIYFQNLGESSIPVHQQQFIYWGSSGDVDTYIYEHADDELRIACDSALVMTLTSSGITLGAGATVDTIETTLTDDSTHIPTSAAVWDALEQSGFYGATITTNTGTYVSGDIDSVSDLDDGDFYEVTEVTGVPGFDIEINYVSVDKIANFIFINAWYDGSASHTVNVQLWNWTGTPQWDTIGVITNSNNYRWVELEITDPTDYISGSNEVDLRFYHATTGDTSHSIKLDFVILTYIPEAIKGKITHHGSLTGLDSDDHTQYALLNGRSGDVLKIDDLLEYTADAGVGIEGTTFIDSYIVLSEIDTSGLGSPGSSAANEGFIYMDSADDKLYFMNSTTTYDLTSGGSSYWDRSSAGVLSTDTPGDDVLLEGDLYFDTEVGTSSAGHLPKYIYWGEPGDWDTYIYESADDVLDIYCGSTQVIQYRFNIIYPYVGLSFIDIIGTWNSRNDSLMTNTHTVYSNTASNNVIVTYRRYGGTFASSAAAPTDADIVEIKGRAHDGTSQHDIALMGYAVDGAVSTGSVSGRIYFQTRETTGSLTEQLSIEKDGSIYMYNLTNDEAETNVIGYDTATGKLSYMSVPSGGFGGGGGYWDRSSAGDLSPVTDGDNILMNGGNIYAEDGFATHGDPIGIYAGSASGSVNLDGGDLTLQAGDGSSSGGDADGGNVYIVPGQEYGTGTKGVIYLGNDTIDDDIVLQVKSSDTSAHLRIFAKGSSGYVYIGSPSGGAVQIDSATTIYMAVPTTYFGEAAGDGKISGRGAAAGFDLTVTGGSSLSSDNDGGDVFIYGGAPNGVGTRGQVYLGDGSSIATLQNDEAETNVVGYDTTTGLLTYMSVPSGGLGGGGSVSFGSQYEIPYTNATTDDFDYSADFTYTGTALTFGAGKYISMDEVDIRDGSTKVFNYMSTDWILRIGEAGNDSMTGDYGIFIGNEAGLNMGAGGNNIVMGRQAFYTAVAITSAVVIGAYAAMNRTSGSSLVSIGYEAGRYATSGNRCTFVGGGAGRGNTVTAPTGGDNTFIGFNSGYDYTTAASCVAIGRNALFNTNTGSGHIAIGAYAMNDNTGGSGNMAIGYYALNSLTGAYSYNIAIGYDALRYTQSGSFNLGIGFGAGKNIDGNSSNVAIGYSACANGNPSTSVCIGAFAGNNIDGLRNVFVGAYAGNGAASSAGSDAQYNVAIGFEALDNLDDGDYNVAIGAEAGQQLTDASYNFLLGFQAGDEITTGNYNFVIGYNAGATITDGTYNLLIGHQVDVDAAGDDYVFRIGYGSTYLLEGSMASGSEYLKAPEGMRDMQNVAKAQILYTNTTQTTIITLPAGAVIWDIQVEVVTAFTGTGTDLLDIGVTGTGNRYEDDLDISSTGWKTLTLTNVPDRMTGTTNITFQYFDQNSDAGAGEAAVYIIYSLH